MTKLTAYLSHSWLTSDIDLNLGVAEQLWCDFVLATDPLGTEYYISRIEALIRRCDVFVAVMPAHGGEASPYISFELRLAERAGKPRLVLYGPGAESELDGFADAYTCHVELQMVEQSLGLTPTIIGDVKSWIDAVRDARSLIPHVPTGCAAVIVTGRVAEYREAVGRGIDEAGFESTAEIMPSDRDTDVLSKLRASDLLVADVNCREYLDIYGMTHGVFTPTIRFFSGDVCSEATLPTILRGHTVGYQCDLIASADPREIEDGVAKRAKATKAVPKWIDGPETCRAMLRARANFAD